MSDKNPIKIDDDSRYDAFARLKARGYSNRSAYMNAGFQRYEYDPADLVREPEIKQRISEYLDQQEAESAPEDMSNMDLPSMYNLTAEWVIGKLMSNAQLAMDNGAHAAANKSLEMLGQHIGLFGGNQGKDPKKVAAQVQASLPDLINFAEKFSKAKQAEPVEVGSNDA